MMGKPKIRFKGYNEDWEQRKLWETCSRVQGNDGRMELPTLTISAANGWMKQEDRFSGNIAGKEHKNYTLLHKGELSYNHGNSKLAKYGTVFSLQTYEEALVPRVYHSFKVESGSADFIEYYFATKMPDRELRKLISSGARMDGLLNIGYNDFVGIKMMFPSTLEQDKIAEYFRVLDHLITLHHRECVILQKTKVNDWEQRKLGEVVEFLDTMRKPLEGAKRISGPYPYYGASGIVDYVDGYLFDEELILLSEDGANITDRNYPVCFLASGKYWVNNHAHVLKTKEGNENNFICNSLERKDYKQYNTGMAMPKLNQEVCKGIPISCPTFAEQKKIGDYFRRLDHLITLHHRKCVVLRKKKVNDWEQRKFGDFTWDAGKRNKEDLDLEPYAITNEHGFIRQCDAHDDFGYMKDTDRKAYNIVKPNSFAYNPARINVGSIGYYKGVENVIVSSLYEVFQTDNYVNDRFLWHWFKSDEFPRWIERLQEGSVRLYFYYDKLCECQLYMPSLEEQEKIASFLDNLDHLITLHQHKCDELQNLKKYMLQNMFV